jgi:hypothetical protein
MAGYIGSKAVNLSTTGADIAGDADVSGALDVGGAFTSQGIDDNANATAITIDSSENVGIGTSSPVVPLTIYNNNSQILFHNSNTGTTTTDGFQIGMGGGSSTAAYIIQNENDSIFLLNRSASGSIIASTNNTERMRIDASGRVTKPYQPAFGVTKGNNQSYTGGSGMNIVTGWTGGKDPYNIGGHMNTGTGRFTAPVSGIYQFSATVLLMNVDSGDDSLHVAFSKNGTLFHYLDLRAAGSSAQGSTGYGGYLPATGTVSMDLGANDYVELTFNSTGNIGLYGGDEWSRFQGYLLG